MAHSEELRLREKVLNLVKDFQESIKKLPDGTGVLPALTADNELAYRLWINIERIKTFNGLRGYVVLNDDTIICVTSSSYIWQFDGRKEDEIR